MAPMTPAAVPDLRKVTRTGQWSLLRQLDAAAVDNTNKAAGLGLSLDHTGAERAYGFDPGR
jgi:hypothetical protein